MDISEFKAISYTPPKTLDVLGFEFKLVDLSYPWIHSSELEYLRYEIPLSLSLVIYQNSGKFNIALVGSVNFWGTTKSTLEEALVGLYEQITFHTSDYEIKCVEQFQQSEIYKKMKELYNIKDILE